MFPFSWSPALIKYKFFSDPSIFPSVISNATQLARGPLNFKSQERIRYGIVR